MADSSEGVKKERIGIGLKIFFVILVIIFVLFLIFTLDVIFGNGGLTGNVISSVSGSSEKIVCKQQAYDETESYTEVQSGSNCDSVSGCSCLHKSWLGLGPCDSCSCQKTRTVTKYKDVCIKVKMWQTPNYNENWLNYAELYDGNGNRIK